MEIDLDEIIGTDLMVKLKYEMDGRWLSKDFEVLLRSTNFLYDTFLTLQILLEGYDPGSANYIILDKNKSLSHILQYNEDDIIEMNTFLTKNNILDKNELEIIRLHHGFNFDSKLSLQEITSRIGKEFETVNWLKNRALFKIKNKIESQNNYLLIDVFDRMFDIELIYSKKSFDILDLEKRETIEKHRNRLAKLTIKSLNYNSPGWTDLLGVGEVLKQIREFISSMFELKSLIQKRKLENEVLQEEIRRMRIENSYRIVELTRKVDYNDKDQLNNLLNETKKHEDGILKLILEDKLKGVHIVPAENK